MSNAGTALNTVEHVRQMWQRKISATTAEDDASMTEPLPKDLDTSRLDSTVRNFHSVTPYLFRGGQPGATGIKELAAAGIKTVVCLRWGKKTIAAEQAAVEAAGMRFISMPMYYWRLPGIDVTEQFLNLVDDKNNWPLFLHCFHGADRTGLLIAMFRITRQGWHVDHAYREMKALGFHRFRIRHFKWKLYQYAKALKV
jgi:tyrosine-protein phosphatase SIW14